MNSNRSNITDFDYVSFLKIVINEPCPYCGKNMTAEDVFYKDGVFQKKPYATLKIICSKCTTGIFSLTDEPLYVTKIYETLRRTMTKKN